MATQVKPQAAALAFEGATADACSEVRTLCDGVLAKASNQGITPATDNDALLSQFIIPDKIQFLYIKLNQAFAHRIGFKPFTSSEIKKTATVGSVREGCYAHCGGLKCSHT